eukprot:601446-Hanusia_phi.AAC.1
MKLQKHGESLCSLQRTPLPAGSARIITTTSTCRCRLPSPPQARARGLSQLADPRCCRHSQASLLAHLAYSLCVWKSRRDIAPVRTIPMSRRSSAVSQPHVQEDKGADSSFLQQLKVTGAAAHVANDGRPEQAGGFLDEAEVGECSDEGKKEETLAIMVLPRLLLTRT